jgi:lysophospholipase L1-like esterase
MRHDTGIRRIAMRLIAARFASLAVALLFVGQAGAPPARSPAPPVRILLVGDSTVATRNGWGDAFCALAARTVTCVNLARNGRSSKSYRAEGLWAKVQGLMAAPGARRRTYVFIQFGHNDQPGKPGRSSDLATELIPNLERYVADARAAGATPVLITPLTRRTFQDGLLQDALSPWAAATRKAAAHTHAPLLDLASDSVFAVQTMGPVKAMELAQAPPPQVLIEAAANGTTIDAPKPPQGVHGAFFDYTHLGPKGAALFAGMVREEVRSALPALARSFP